MRFARVAAMAYRWGKWWDGIENKHKILKNPLPPPPLYGRAGVADDARRRRLRLVERGSGGERGIE